MAKAVKKLFKGVDVGNGYTKAGKVTFASRVKVGTQKVGGKKAKKDIHFVNYNGQDYIVGEGKRFTGDNRYFTDQYQLCLLTAIALNFPKEDFIEIAVCVGLPVNKHGLLADKLKEHLTGLQQQITVNDKKCTIRIKECEVFIEGALPILTGEDGRILTIDMGAGTINVTEFEDGAIEDYTTYPDSMYNLYREVADHLNRTKGSEFTPVDIEPLLNKKTAVINQEEVDITDIRPIIQTGISEMASFIKESFKYKSANKIYCIGGGCSDTYQYWEKEFPKAVLHDSSQSVNSKVYDIIAEGLVTDGQ